ncbi:hypothetical protein CRYUN_Cryun12cG0188300 [Craigia yunnanensis]
MERQSDGTYIKKGPWTAEEDEVLMNYMKKYGPRGWSNIRSMELLPRIGKSCRLRWINKLRPNLKTLNLMKNVNHCSGTNIVRMPSGCKFSADEERVVIELHAEFDARENFVDTYIKVKKNKGKDPVLYEMPMVEVPPCNCIPLEQGSSSHEDQSKRPSFSANSEEFRMVPLPDLIKPDVLNLETVLPILDIGPIQMIPSPEPSVNYPVSLLPQLQLDLPILPECQDLSPEPMDFNFVVMFKHQEASESESKPKSLTRFSSAGIKGNAQIGKEEDRKPCNS